MEPGSPSFQADCLLSEPLYCIVFYYLRLLFFKLYVNVYTNYLVDSIVHKKLSLSILVLSSHLILHHYTVSRQAGLVIFCLHFTTGKVESLRD